MKRTPYQGVTNIIRFNPGMFITAGLLILAGVVALSLTAGWLQISISLALAGAVISLSISLIASHWIYDKSEIYTLPSLKNCDPKNHENWLTINAGFDEITPTLKTRFPDINLRILDFYDPEKHTESSIARARNAYPPHPETETTTSNSIPAETSSIQKIIAFFSLHEIRNHEERVTTFNDLRRTLTKYGELHLTEHLRDLPNLVAYNFGALHFHTRNAWEKTFDESNFAIKSATKTSPFVTTFVLIKK
ncbi:MAG: hypothetical protein ACI9SQ_001815 [Rubritalea sp.]|jgi:hypothetical protein